MNPTNYKIKAIKDKIKKSRLKDKTLRLKGNYLQNDLGDLNLLEETQIRHHPNWYEDLEQKIKKNLHEKNMEIKYKNLLEIIHNPSLIGLPKESKVVRTAFLKNEEEKNRIHLLMEFRDIFYLISLKQKDNKTSRRRTKRSLLEANEFLIYDYGLRNLKLLYVRDDFKTDELVRDKFMPFNYTPNQ